MMKAVIFDMDGLMFDTESAYSVVHEKMFLKRDMVFTLDIKAGFMGRRSHEVMESVREIFGTEESVEALLKEQDDELSGIYTTTVGKLTGLDNLITFLKEKKIRKCIGTSSRGFLVDILLKKHRLGNEFEFIVSGDMVQRGKPDPEIYTKCLTQLNLKGSDCLVLEDSLNGIKAGVSAGCKTCAVPSPFTKHEDFGIADIVAQSLDDQIIKDFIG